MPTTEKKDEVLNIATKAVIFFNDRVLVLQRSEDDDFSKNEYDLPGGRMISRESVEESLRREVLEETGLHISILSPFRVWDLYKNDVHIVGITFLSKSTSSVVALSHEHKNSFWVSENEIGNLDLTKWLESVLIAAFNEMKR